LAMSKASWYDFLLSSVATEGKYNVRNEWVVAVGRVMVKIKDFFYLLNTSGNDHLRKNLVVIVPL